MARPKKDRNVQDTISAKGLVEFSAERKNSKIKPGDMLRVHIAPALPELTGGRYFVCEFRRIDDGAAELLTRSTNSTTPALAKRTRSKSKVGTAKTPKGDGGKGGAKVARRKVPKKETAAFKDSLSAL